MNRRRKRLKRGKSDPPRASQRSPGQLEQRGSYGRQTILLFLAFFQTLSYLVIAGLTLFLQIKYYWLAAQLPLHLDLAFGALNGLVGLLYLRSPVSKRPPYQGLPVEWIDFSYVFRFQWRIFLVCVGLLTINLIPALVSIGFLDQLAERALAYDLPPTIASTLSWMGTAILGGVLANLVTFLLLAVPRWVARKIIKGDPKENRVSPRRRTR